MSSILTIGSATQDIFLKSKSFEEKPEPSAPDGFNVCFSFGAKISVDEIFYASGGGAMNAAVTFARFGHRTTVLTCIGQDRVGDDIISELERERIDTHLIQRHQKEKTATSVILLSGTGHRAILTYRGATRQLAIPSGLPKTDWVYLTSLGDDRNAFHHVFAHAKKNGASVAWNPGNAELERGMENLAPFLQQTSVLILNREEAAALTGLPARQLDRLINSLTLHVTRSTSHALIITDGGRGAYVATQNRLWFAPPLKARRVNTTGAGDAFGSAFVAAIASGAPPNEAMRAAMLNATGVVTHMGAKAGILAHAPSAEETRRVTIEEKVL